MGAWIPWQWPTEPVQMPDWQVDDLYAEMESLDERAEQEPTDLIPVEESNDWGAWLEDGERPVPNTGS